MNTTDMAGEFDELTRCPGCGKLIAASVPSTTLEDEQYHDDCAMAEILKRQKESHEHHG